MSEVRDGKSNTMVFLVLDTHERDEGCGGRGESAGLSVREFKVKVETPVLHRPVAAPFARVRQNRASECLAGNLGTRPVEIGDNVAPWSP